MGLDPSGHRIPKVEYGQITITSNMTSSDDIETLCCRILREYQVVVQNTGVSANAETGRRTLTIYVRSRRLEDKYEIMKKLLSLPGVLDVAW